MSLAKKIVQPDQDGRYDIDGVSLDSKEGVVVSSDGEPRPKFKDFKLVKTNRWRHLLRRYWD